MINYNININLETIENEIQYLFVDYERMLSEYKGFNETKTVEETIQHVEEMLRLQKRIESYLAS